MSKVLLSGKNEETKESELVAHLRGQIVRGDLAPGSRLATRRELEQSLAVSRFTLQRVLHRLIRDGFVHAKGPKGTYVVENPPHLSNYHLVFPERDSSKDPWPRFWLALAREAIHIAEESKLIKISNAYHSMGKVDSEDYQSLLRVVRNQKTAGLIFVGTADGIQDTPLVEGDIPKVQFRMEPEAPGPHPVPVITMDVAAFMDKALTYLLDRGRRQIAILSTPEWFIARADAVRSCLAARHVEVPPSWMQAVHRYQPQFANNCAQLLMREEPHRRPDGLIIADDNLVEHAAAGLIAADVKMPRDLEIVAHCNFPWPSPSVVPVKRLGFDADEAIRLCLENLNRQRNGQDVPRQSLVDAVFEDEL
jgi:DNA-binding LacI/PurR family transcriptional regulator